MGVQPHRTRPLVGLEGSCPAYTEKEIHPEEHTLRLTQGDQSLVVPPHHSLVQILLPAVQRLPFLLVEVHGNVIKRERYLESQAARTW